MRIALAYLLLTALAVEPGWSQVGRPLSVGRQVITAETLRHAGLRRISEIFALVDDWDATSVQGFTWEASPRGLASYGRPGWSVMLDGQIIELGLFGVRSLERLPVTLGQIDSMTVIAVPGSHRGAFVEAGILHIHTRTPDRGLSVRAHATTASETGDPGPYLFTELSTPNIDRIGSSGSGLVSYAGRRAFIELIGSAQEHFVTDPRIRRRNDDISVEYPIVKQSAASLRTSVEFGTSRHALYAGYSSTRDYFFLKQYGREVPVESPFAHIGVDGSFDLPRSSRLGYRVAYSSSALNEHENTLDIGFDWEMRHLLADVEASRWGDSYSAKLGLGVVSTVAETGYRLSDDEFTLYEAHGELGYRLGAAHDQTLAAHLVAAPGDLGLKASLAHRWRPDPSRRLEAVLAYSERTPEEDGRIWYWYQRGYDFLPDNGIPATIDGELEEARTLSLDLNWSASLSDRTRYRLGGNVRSFSSLSLEEQPFQFDSESGAFVGPVRLVTDRSGAIAGVYAGADWVPLRELELGAYYRYQDVLDGEALFADAWRTVPRHRLRLTAVYVPVRSFSLQAAFRYRSSSRWADYRDAEAQSEGFYSYKVDEAFALHLNMEKWFWDRRLRLHLALRNIFDEDVPHHPIGPAYGLTIAIQGELLLNGM